MFLKTSSLGTFNIFCILFHKWKKVKDTGATIYWECKRCGKKEIISTEFGYQPIDTSFLNR
jgi:hypothetical protein